MSRPNMTRAIHHEDEALIFCTDTEQSVKCAVIGFQEEVYLEVAITHVGRLKLQYDDFSKVYIGNMGGLEFQSNGPKRIV